ncbi:MAG: hypothetical protein JKY67_10235 [Pseudomonadales bacterium]|nr:hypothetical protein [Pseudomonadales bacterium]
MRIMGVVCLLISACAYQDLRAPVPGSYEPINNQFENEKEVRRDGKNASRDSK